MSAPENGAVTDATHAPLRPRSSSGGQNYRDPLAQRRRRVDEPDFFLKAVKRAPPLRSILIERDVTEKLDYEPSSGS